MNVLFFDIDGVVCTLRSHFAFGDKGGLMQAWDITACQMIRKLCSKHHFKIVVSSTWRFRPDHCRLYLATYGLIDHLYPHADPAEWTTPKQGKNRGKEIKVWLGAHPEVKNFIILDDDRDFLEDQKPFHIHTDSSDGFSSQDFMAFEELVERMT